VPPLEDEAARNGGHHADDVMDVATSTLDDVTARPRRGKEQR
jgi:hypothetical protein